MGNETETGSPSPMFRSTWLTVFVVEFAVISIINGFTILTFASLTIADFFVGTVSGPLHIYHTMTFERGSGFGWEKFIVLFLERVFTTCSLLHLALLSLERLHASSGERHRCTEVMNHSKTKKMADKREICMREYDKKVVLCESEITYASKV